MTGISNRQYPDDPTRSYGKHDPDVFLDQDSTIAPNDGGFFTTTETSVAQDNMVIVGVLVGIVVVLLAVFLVIMGPPLMQYIKRKIPDDPKKIQRRYETIEGWLISKRVRAHDDTCDRVRNECCDVNDAEKALKLSDSYDTVETADTSYEDKECPICMEEFRLNEIVSWSPNLSGNCVHVFHHECIKEWLLRHGNCPFCREVFLPVDDKEFENKPQEISIEIFSKKRLARVKTTYYCLTDGLVTIRNKSEESSKEESRRIRAVTASRLKKNELAELRGGRSELTNGSCDLDASNGQDPEMGNTQRLDDSNSIFRPTTSAQAEISIESRIDEELEDASSTTSR